MRILLDECMPRLLKDDIVGHEARTVAEMGWAGINNGKLLNLADEDFDVFLTVDRGIEYQQNFQNRHIALIILDSGNRLPDLQALIPALLGALNAVQPGSILHISP